MTRDARSTALTIRGLVKSFPVGFWGRRRTVLRGLDLDLAQGSSLGLVGPNGSGKTTLLRIAAGLESPTRGSTLLFGSTPEDPSARSRIGYLPEASPYPEELAARAALELVASLHAVRRSERRARASAWLERVGLATAADSRLGTYSGGMLRRFGLAAACLHAPDLLLLDEPTAGLDAEGHVILSTLLAEFRARGAALVISSHHLNDVVDHTDHMSVLIDGRLVASGAPLELVGSTGRVRLEVEGLDERGLERLRREVERAGGRVVSCGPTTGALVELYRRATAGAGEPEA